MKVPVIKSMVNDGRYAVCPLADHTVDCYHGDDPRRISYGATMYDVWSRQKDCPGMVWIESDIAIEPLHLSEMSVLIELDPTRVVAVPFRLYPASTHSNIVVWPFYVLADSGHERILEATEEIPFKVRSFGLGCTYLPARVFELFGKKLREWDWPSLDWRMAVAARDEGIEIVTTKTPAVHLHY